MIDFKSRNKAYNSQAYKPDVKKKSEDYIIDIKSRITSDFDDKFSLGVKLIEFYSSKSYAYRCSDLKIRQFYGHYVDRNAHSNVFFAVCEIEFGLDKSEVSRLMNVVDEFGKRDKKKGIQEKYKDFKWSVLVEMLPMSDTDRAKVKPDMTVKQVRKLKKDLVATSQHEDEEKEKEPERFKKITRKGLISMILSLEAELEEFREKDNEDNEVI